VTCPACGEVLTTGQERCSFCGAVVSPRVEGALAPEPATVTPPPRDKAEPLRELPGLRKREKTWKDEVSERVRHRRRKRAGLPDLPLFSEEALGAGVTTSEEKREASLDAPRVELRELERPGLAASEPADLPLRPAAEPMAFDREIAAAKPRELGEAPLEEPRPEPPHEEWPREVAAHPPEIKPVERPARFAERVRAGGLDLALLAGLWAIVIYFAGRAAHVPLPGLRPNWPYLAAYLAFLGLGYAVYFTGTTGQTPGKMVAGLRVVDTGGQPPGYARALLRAALGVVGILAAGLGLLPMVFDPARRTLHDRLLRTRVVKG